MSNMRSHVAYVTNVHRHSWSANSQSMGSTWEAKRLLAASFLFARWVLAFARGETNWSTNLVGACQWDRIFQWILLSAPTGRNVVHASTGSPSGQLPPNLLGSSGGQVDKAIRIALPGSVHWAGTFGLANWDMAL